MSRIKRRARKEARDAGFVFEAPKRGRFQRYFKGISVEGLDRWWIKNPGIWVENYRDDSRWKDGVSSHAECRTLRAFRSHLRRHRKELAGCTVILHSGFVGSNVTVNL